MGRTIALAAALLALAGAVAGLTSPAPAQDQDETPAQGALKASPEAGLALADRLCKGCHVIRDGVGTATAGVPTFRSIANKLGQTRQHIASVLIKPHRPMPDMQLTTSEITQLLAYFESLRTNPNVPPLLPPGLNDKSDPKSNAG